MSSREASSTTVIVDLQISSDDFLTYYHSPQAVVLAKAIDGRRIQFPAGIIRRFVTHAGIQGRFCIHFDQASGKYQRIEKIA